MPQNIWWLLSLLPALLLFALYYRWRKKKQAAFGGSKVLASLFPGFSWRRIYWRDSIFLLALVLLAVAMMSPQVPDEQSGTPVSGLEMVMAIDVSNSMLANDAPPTRLDQTRLIAQKLMDTLQGSKIAVVAFAGEAWLQLPLTNDLRAARLLVSGVDGKSVPLEGTDIEAALQVSNQSLPTTDRKHKAILLFTDGEALEGDANSMVDELKKAGVMLITVGIGTPAGATLKDETGLPIRQEDGTAVISKLNEPELKALAEKTGGKFIAPGAPDAVAASILQVLESMPKQPLVNSYMVNYFNYSHWLIAAAIVLLLIAVFISEFSRKLRRKKLAALLALAFMVSIQGMAQGNANASNAKLSQADELYRKGNLDAAETLYKEVAKADPNAWQAWLQLGNIAYKRGGFDDAMQQYDQSLKNANTATANAALQNNKGLSLARSKKLEDAISAFKQALRADPGDAEITRNLNMAIDELKKAQKQPPPPKPDPKKNKQKADDQLNALQQEEKKIKDKMQQQKNPAKSNNNKNW
ncbi:MAG TPA: VWA domain-containing protein [Phnomibacter sp.]|nr:VWA domain-containing protein [Phnomibacter sp.]